MTVLTKTALFSAVFAAIKLVAFFLTGSLLVLGSSLDSLMDSLVSGMNSYVNRLAHEDADSDHPFGHGGFEVIASLIQGVIIVGSGLLLAAEAAKRLYAGDHTTLLDEQQLGTGVLVLGFAAGGGWLLQTFLAREQARLEKSGQRSLSVIADQAHYTADFWANMLSALGLGCIWLLGMPALDSLFTFIVAGFFFKTGGEVMLATFADITHKRLDPSLQQAIVAKIMGVSSQIQGVHRLRSRRSGPITFVDFHMKLPATMSLQEAHDIGDKVSATLRQSYPKMDVIIHLDPDTEPDDETWQPLF